MSENCPCICLKQLEKLSSFPDPWLPDFPWFCPKRLALSTHIYIYIRVYIYIYIRIYIYIYNISFYDLHRSSHSLNSLRSLHFSMRPQRGGLHKSDIDICQRSHHRSDRTHQMRKIPGPQTPFGVSEVTVIQPHKRPVATSPREGLSLCDFQPQWSGLTYSRARYTVYYRNHSR